MNRPSWSTNQVVCCQLLHPPGLFRSPVQVLYSHLTKPITFRYLGYNHGLNSRHTPLYTPNWVQHSYNALRLVVGPFIALMVCIEYQNVFHLHKPRVGISNGYNRQINEQSKIETAWGKSPGKNPCHIHYLFPYTWMIQALSLVGAATHERSAHLELRQQSVRNYEPSHH